MPQAFERVTPPGYADCKPFEIVVFPAIPVSLYADTPGVMSASMDASFAVSTGLTK